MFVLFQNKSCLDLFDALLAFVIFNFVFKQTKLFERPKQLQFMKHYYKIGFGLNAFLPAI